MTTTAVLNLIDRVEALQQIIHLSASLQSQLPTCDRDLSHAITQFNLSAFSWLSQQHQQSPQCAPVPPIDHVVSAQYDEHPYPVRDPNDERELLRLASPGNILELNHLAWYGRRNFAEPLRVLVAGGGTGDSVVCLAQHLSDLNCPAKLFVVDLSPSSLQTCMKRLGKRRLPGKFMNSKVESEFGDRDDSTVFVTLIVSNLLDISSLATKFAEDFRFDYIDCCGVLHHLPDPAAGLRALTCVLKPDGVIGLMVYGQLGRSGVYAVQQLIRLLSQYSRDDNTPSRLKLLREVLHTLPESHALRNNRAIMSAADLDSDAGLVDLFLHACDVAMDARQLDGLLTSAGLASISHLPRRRTNPASMLPPQARAPVLHELTKQMNAVDSALFCELWSGDAIIHTVLAKFSLADLSSSTHLIPSIASSFSDALLAANQETVITSSAWTAFSSWSLVPCFIYPEDILQRYVVRTDVGLSFRGSVMPWSQRISDILMCCEGTKTLGRIYAAKCSDSALFIQDIQVLWSTLEPLGLLCASLTPFPFLWDHSYK